MNFIKNNQKLLLIALGAFVLNQLVELGILLWVGRNWSSLCQWDCTWYGRILSQGYDLIPHGHVKGDAANWAFLPLFPFLSKIIYSIVGKKMALVLTSKILFVTGIFAFMKTATLYRPKIPVMILGVVVALQPYSLYANMGYTEPLFFFLSCLFFYYLKLERPIMTGLAGAFLTGTRVNGVNVLFSFLVKFKRPSLQNILGFMLIPLGITCFMFFLYHHMGDALAFLHVQRAWGRSWTNPFTFLWLALSSSDIIRYWASLTILTLVSLCYFVRTKEYDLFLFSFTSTLMPVLTGGLMSMPRFIFWQYPVLLLISILISKKKIWIVVFPIFVMGLIYNYLALFDGELFIP